MQIIKNRQFGAHISRFFDKIYCINLDKRPDRWSYVQKHTAKFGLKKHIERFSAIDVRSNPKLRIYEKLVKENFSTLAMCGCTLSHRRIIEQAKQAGLKNVLVFEDDIKILKDNIGNIQNSLEDLAELEWDVFYLGATYLYEIESVGEHLINVSNGTYGAHAIAYNHSIFDHMLDLLPNDPQTLLQSDRFEVNVVDVWLQSKLFDHSKFYGTNPIMIVQGLQNSDLAFNQQDGIEQKQIDLFSKNLKS